MNRLQLGAPGVTVSVAPPEPTIRAVRLDAAGFAGVAARGPVDTPVLVRSPDEYRRHFGPPQGPGLLGAAVTAFFAQGGERAWVLRVGPAGTGRRPGPEHDPHVSRFTVGPVRLAAASPGSWGDALRIELRGHLGVPVPLVAPDGSPPGPGGPGRVVAAPRGLAVPAGTLLAMPGGGFRWVDETRAVEVAPGRRVPVLVLDRDPGPGPAGPALVVTLELIVRDPHLDPGREERFTGVGLDPAHPRFMAGVLVAESELVVPVGDWVSRRLPAPQSGVVWTEERESEGLDVDSEVGPSSFFDDRDEEPDPQRDEPPWRGTAALAAVPDVALLVVPDLFWTWREETPDPEPAPAPAASGFGPCGPPEPPVRYRPSSPSRLLDARTPDDRAEMQARAGRLVALAERHRRFVVLLDVPAGLQARDIARWRAGFDSSWAAAYHPWVRVPPEDGRPGGPAIEVPPSAVAAGIVAARELRLGLPWGPANEIAVGVVAAVQTVTDAEHAELHPLGINVFRAERDGFRLTAARTLSRDPALRQLTVRRLMTMLTLSLEREAQWVVFEPLSAGLVARLRLMLLAFLDGWYRAGAFTGDSPEQAFVVRAVAEPADVARGRLVVEVGVAPAEPLEFLVVRLIGDRDGGLRAEEVRRG